MPSMLLLSDQSPNQIELTASPEQKEEEEEKTDRKVLQPSFPKWRKLESNRTWGIQAEPQSRVIN